MAFTHIAKKLKGKESLSIAIVMFALGLGNSAGVFANIGIAVIPIGIFLSRAIGGDAFLGFLVVYFGLMSGFSIGFANPSILGVAQMIAEVPIFSGTLARAIPCVLNIIFLYLVTVSYYRMIKKDPQKSLNYEERLSGELDSFPPAESGEESSGISKRQLVIVATFLIGVVICVVSTILFRWNANKIASWFIGLTILSGILSGFSMNQISQKFIKGCMPMVSASFVVGVASAVSLILKQGMVLDTIVNFLSMPLSRVGAIVGAGLMVLINAAINIFIPSGSGQAAVVMPLMVPMADLVGITRQVAVQAFQFGDGLSNLATPLNGPMMGCLAIAGVGFPRYIRWAYKYILLEIIAATVYTMILQYLGWTGL